MKSKHEGKIRHQGTLFSYMFYCHIKIIVVALQAQEMDSLKTTIQ